MLDVRKLSLLRELERHGSLVGVSRALGISSSAISQQLTKLESEVGMPLLERIGRNVQLTPAGQLLARRVGQVEEILEDAEADLELRRSRVQGVVRFAAFSTFAIRYVPELLRRMRETHPDVVVEFAHVEPTEALEAVAGRRADIAVTDEYPGIPRATDTQMTSTFLLRDAISVYVPSEVASVTELAELPWMLEPIGSGARVWAERMCHGAGFSPRVLFESPDLRLHYDLAAEGLAAVFLPDMVAQDERIRASNLADYRFEWPADTSGDLYRDVFAVMRRGGDRRPAVAAFMAHMKDVTAFG
ncbi:MAG: LysR family transcriptional regulator [Gulosibacter sp.]|uniref:LysR family transcriptional regulator n=1 Tax=Gulosibacter sp. TaxID=2817531 RepID=UPI003F8FB78A